MVDLDNVIRLRRLFNLTPDEARAIHKWQNGECAICQNPLTICSPGANIDHDHKTGEVRGWLCHLCNRALGMFLDNPDLLLLAHAYLQGPPARYALAERRYGRIGRTTNKLGRHKRKNLRPRGESLADYAPTAVYVCGCQDYDPRPLIKCPVHKQPEQRTAQAGGLAISGDALTKP